MCTKHTDVFTQEDRQGFYIHPPLSECVSQHNRNTKLTSQISSTFSVWNLNKFQLFQQIDFFADIFTT